LGGDGLDLHVKPDANDSKVAMEFDSLEYLVRPGMAIFSGGNVSGRLWCN
jgi:hypothetical protein